jgi:hypothetical protein
LSGPVPQEDVAFGSQYFDLELTSFHAHQRQPIFICEHQVFQQLVSNATELENRPEISISWNIDLQSIVLEQIHNQSEAVPIAVFFFPC